MSMETVKRLAALAGDDVEHTLQSDMDFLERFAELVASKAGEVMRERCADSTPHISCDATIRALPGATLEDLIAEAAIASVNEPR